MHPLGVVQVHNAIERPYQRSAAGKVLSPVCNPPMLVRDRFLQTLDEGVGTQG
jgi:hypothetical protein